MRSKLGPLLAVQHLAARGLEAGEDVQLSRLIKVPSAVVWNAITRPGCLMQYHSYCKENAVYRWPGVGSRDGLTYYSGLYFERDFVAWIDGVGYDLEIGPPPRKTSHISWRILPVDGDSCELTISVTPLLRSDWSEVRKAEYQRHSFGETIKQYLDSVLRSVEYFVTTGEPVKRNQFGAHPVYSE